LADYWAENIDFSKSLGMALPGVENVGVPCGSILELSRPSQLPYTKKSKNVKNIKNWPRPPLTPIHLLGEYGMNSFGHEPGRTLA
jgi:hypothetical protein